MPLWFKAKTYGYGWTPCTWQGWLVTGIYIVLTIGTLTVIDSLQLSDVFAAMAFVPLVLIYTFVLLYICVKTGEKARWRWGGK